MIKLTRILHSQSQLSDYGVSVHFTDLDDKTVSLAFDGRYDKVEESGFGERLEYGIYRGCPIIDKDDCQSGPIPDITVIRNLRNALNNLNLGD